ncbi:snf 1 [Ephemerocybe angulata]|uniref:Snf 1 n=1 Tax=Ephemerocybe angulata TaxID=980116 RepID=A0A8H6I9H8_9AGAR|nr:snf 1 [Tulosesus angulatus]
MPFGFLATHLVFEYSAPHRTMITAQDGIGAHGCSTSTTSIQATHRHTVLRRRYEVISTPTDIIFVLEYAEAELFNYIVTHGRMQRARRFFQQIIHAIEYSHRLKVVHRDLKPERVLLDDDLNVKIADFGLSNEISDGDFLTTSCGSPNYAAPEVIRGGVYAGPEIDVWSSGVILYVMLCGRLPFEDDDVQVLFQKITQGTFHLPSSLGRDARDLITQMLAVDPVKRITIQKILEHPFYKTDLPRYLQPLPPPPGPVLGALSSLVEPVQPLDFEIIEGLGRIEEDVVEQLAGRMASRRRISGSACAATTGCRAMRSRLLAKFAEAERDAILAARDPRNALSPTALPPTGTDMVEANPFEAEFNAEYDEYEDEGELVEEDDLDFYAPPADAHSSGGAAATFAQLPEQHHLTSYVSAKRSGRGGAAEKKSQHRTKWHFGIRSRSPPMEVMLEIYRTLKTLGMEWKEKRNLGGLGGLSMQSRRDPFAAGDARGRAGIERAREYDGDGGVDLKAAASIYFVETRCRVQDVVVLMNLQLYMVDSINYLVDFHHKKSYKASVEPGAGRFDMAHFEVIQDSSSDSSRSVKEKEGLVGKEDEVVSPFVFMDVACRLILELAGGGEAA